MADTNYLLQKKPWKVWMSSAPDPTAVLVSASDLINGTSLGHNILIYNGSLHSSAQFISTNIDDFYRYEIDISPAIFDKRAKPNTIKLQVTNKPNFFKLTQSKADHDYINFYCYDKEAALYPEDLKSFFGVSKTWKTFFRPNSTLENYTVPTGFNTKDCLTISEFSSNVLPDEEFEKRTSGIIVYGKDTVFSSTMVFEDGKNAYTKMRINERNEAICKLLIGAFLLNSDTAIPIKDTNSDNYFGISSNEFLTVYKELKELFLSSPTILDHIYFWVKGPFCADYVDPADFNQNLNQDADVVHRNLLVANSYDKVANNFNRYEESYNYVAASPRIQEFIEKMSRPYIPTNSPLKDFISDGLALSIQIDNLSQVEQSAETLIKNSYEDTDKRIIGSVLSVPGDFVGDPKEFKRFTPFNFYDPESREEVEYYKSLNRIPTLIGRDGNITTDGRIMSPSIDELWYIIKKLISGQLDKGVSREDIPLATPYNEIAIETTLTEAVKSQYQQTFENDAKHQLDPIDFSYTFKDGDITGINLKEYVVQPETIKHKVYNLLQVVSARINAFYEQQNNLTEDDHKLLQDKDETWHYTGESRRITRTGENIIIGTKEMNKKSVPDAEYGPRAKAPLSLRELEAAVLGNKYNIENDFMFISKTYAVTGKFGKVEKDSDGNIISGGSLYQMHRDYNANVENPNTFFRLGGDGFSGQDATFGDLGGVQEMNGTIPVFLLDKNNKRTDKKHLLKMPRLVENYGKSPLLYPEYGKYSGADIFMAADGTWRYKMEHMRLPVLRSRY